MKVGDAVVVHEAAVLKLIGDAASFLDWQVAGWAAGAKACEFGVGLRPVWERVLARRFWLRVGWRGVSV